MGRFLAFIAVLLLAVAPAIAETPQQQLLLLNYPRLSGGYTPPVITNGYAIAIGDSITGNGGGVSYSGTVFSVTQTFGNGYPAVLALSSNGALQFEPSWNFGVQAQDSAGIRARLSSTLNYCNQVSSSTSAICWGGTRISTSTLTSSGATTMCFASTTGVNIGDYISASNVLPGTTVTSLTTGCPVAGVLISQATTGSISSATAITFSAAAKTNLFVPYLGAYTNWSATADFSFNILSTAVYSACNDPAKLVFLMAGTNDNLGGMTKTQSLTNLAAIVDAFGPTGCNKVVIASNMVPRGLATSQAELGTVTGGTVTVTNSANYYDTTYVSYAPVTSGTPFSAGANDGTKLTNCTPCTPASGQYNVAAGVYTFNAAQEGIRMAFYYRYTGNPKGANLVTIHNWWNATSCGSFTDPSDGTTYPLSGAQCRRPWLKVADTWTPTVDAGTGTNYYPIAQFSYDGLHPNFYGDKLIADAMAAKATTYVGSTPLITSPTVNNPIFNGDGSTSTAGQTTTCAVSNLTRNYFLTNLSPAASTGVYAVGQKIYAFSSANLPVGATVDCVDTANNQIHMTSPATGSATFSNNMAQGDTSSIITNGMIDYRMKTTTAVASCNTHCGTPSLGTTITQGYPTGWGLTVGAADTTALNNGILAINYGMESNPLGDGYDDFALTVQGVVGTSVMAVTLSQTTTAITNANLIAVGDKYRAVCSVYVDKGPNGRLWGLTGIQLKATGTSAAVFTAPGTASNTYLQWSGTQGSSATNVRFNDGLVASGPYVFQAVSNVVDTSLMTTPSANISILVQADANQAVSATIRISRCSLKRVTT